MHFVWSIFRDGATIIQMEIEDTSLQQKEHDSVPIDKAIAVLRNRCQWPLIREALKREGLPPGTGWDDLVENSEKSDSADKLRNFIRKFFWEHLLFGTRYVQLYNLDTDLSKTLLAELKETVVPVSIFSTPYPLPLAEASLATAQAKPTLVEIRYFPNGDMALVYCSSQCHDERQNYEYKQLSSVIQGIYAGIDRLVTFRKTYFQAYDVVILRLSLDRIEIAVDQPEKGSGDLDERALNLFEAVVNNIPMLASVHQSGAINIFHAISNIFNATREGVVQRLSFRTLTGSKKTETMVKPTDDLRNEEFHHGGMAAVGHQIRPYELTVKWDFDYPAGSAQLKLSASVTELSRDYPQLSSCFITTNEPSSFVRTVNKVIKHQ